MQKLTVVTSFSKEGYSLYGRKFLNTFYKFWPREIDLMIYHEGSYLDGRAKKINLFEEVYDFLNFMGQYGSDLSLQGKAQIPGHRWKSQWQQEGYAFRWDAVRFCRKIFAIRHAAQLVKKGKLFWIDADVVTFDRVPAAFIDNLLPEKYALCYLGRLENYHSECGFVGYNLDHPVCKKFIDTFADTYLNGTFKRYAEYHDSYIFDHIRKSLSIPSLNLVPHNVDRGHVWLSTDLARYMDHLKGNRKTIGHSEKTDLITARNEHYWAEIKK
jgi:hypothetical protein